MTGAPMADAPTPGSLAARKAGCTCAMLDNGYGRGAYWGENGTALFWITEGCPLHWRPDVAEEDPEPVGEVPA